MSTPITDAAYDAVRSFTNEEQAVDALVEMRETSRKLERENAALRADIHAHEQINRQLIEDKRRLDWLDHNAIPWNWMSPEKIDGLGPIVVTWKSNRTLRAAIDAARNRSDHIGDINEMMQKPKEAQP